MPSRIKNVSLPEEAPMDDLEPIYSDPPESNTLALSIAAAAVIVAGGVYLILDHAAPIVTAPVSTSVVSPETAAVPAAAAPATRTPAVLPSTVYRCTVNGTTMYSDAPCKNGKAVDVSPTSGGFIPTRPTHSAPLVSQNGSPRETKTEPETVNREVSKTAAECASIDAEIARLAALTRQSFFITEQERLRHKRRELTDRQFALKC